MKSNGTRRKVRLSAEDVDELIDRSDDRRARRFWQTIKAEKLRGTTSDVNGLRHRRFLSIPLYNNSIAVIFILALLSFSAWFILNNTSIKIPIDTTQIALIVAFSFSALMFHRYVSDKDEIVGMLDELAGYSVQNESVLENIGSALIVVDATGKVTKVNQRAEDILGLESHELVGRNCQHIFTDQKLADLLLQTLRAGRSIANYEVESESSDGYIYSFQVTTSLLQNKKGYTVGAIELINDITEIRELQEKLRLNEHLASIGELSAKLGHEIGNSLGGIRLYTDNLLEELPLRDHRREYAKEILSEVKHLNTKVNAIKNYSGPVKLDFRKTDDNMVMNEALYFARNDIPKNGIFIEKNY